MLLTYYYYYYYLLLTYSIIQNADAVLKPHNKTAQQLQSCWQNIYYLVDN